MRLGGRENFLNQHKDLVRARRRHCRTKKNLRRLRPRQHCTKKRHLPGTRAFRSSRAGKEMPFYASGDSAG